MSTRQARRGRFRHTIALSGVVLGVAYPHQAVRAQSCTPIGWDVAIGIPGTNADVVGAGVAWDDGSGPALFLGGNFTIAGGVTVDGIAKWDGTNWFSLGGLTNGSFNDAQVFMALFDDGNGVALYTGGDFSLAGGVSANNVAKWNGQTWSPLGSGVTGGDVRAMTVWNNALYVAGRFTVAGSVSAINVAKWNGTAWSALGGGLPGSRVDALIGFNDGTGDALYAGGTFTTAGGDNIARWNGVTWSAVDGGANGPCYALEVFDDGSGPALYAAGALTTAGGVLASKVARWDGAAWSGLGDGISGFFVHALAAFDDNSAFGPALYAGGEFTEAGGQSANRIARWNGTTWSPLGNGVTGVNAYVDYLTPWGNTLYVGGQFSAAGGRQATNIAGWGGGAVEQYWESPNGGNFNDGDNWFCGFEPGPGNTAVFDSTVLPLNGAYTVSLSDANAATRRLAIRTDIVTLNLANHDYQLGAVPFDPTPSLVVGEYPAQDARLIVRNAQTESHQLRASSVSVAHERGSQGQLTVKNASTSSPLSAGLLAEGDLVVGRRGDGTLIVENRATLNYGVDGSVMVVGDEGTGSLTVRTLGILDGQDVYKVSIGAQPGSSGTVLIDAAAWSNMGQHFVVGESGNATLTIAAGGSLSTTTSNTVELAKNPGSSANVTVTGLGSVWSAFGDSFAVAGAGQATLTVTDGGLVEALVVYVLQGGVLSGDSTVLAGVSNLGTISPGPGAAPGDTGVLTIEGDYFQSDIPRGGAVEQSGTLRVDIQGAAPGTGHDQVHVTGMAELAGGLFVETPPGFNPAEGASYQILDATQIDGSFDVALMSALPDGKFLRFDSAAAAGGAINVVVDSLASLFGFNDPQSQSTPALPTDVVVDDLDGDGDEDLAITLLGATPNDFGSVFVIRNGGFNPQGQWIIEGTTQTPVGRQPSGITVGFLDLNPGPDLAVSNAGDDNVFVLSNAGGGAFNLSQVLPVGAQPADIAAADFDEDGSGDVDLVVASEGDGTASVFSNDGSGVFTLGATVIAGGACLAVDPSDLDNDKDAEIVLANGNTNELAVFINPGNGDFGSVTALTFPVGQSPVDLAARDLNNDQFPELVTANNGDSTVSVLVSLFGAPGETFAPAVNLPVGALPRSLTTIDLEAGAEADPDVDIAVVADNDLDEAVVQVLRNDFSDGQLIFAEGAELATGQDPVLVTNGDLDGDTQPDLITVNESPSAPSPLAGPGVGSANVRLNATNGGTPCPWDCSAPLNGVVDTVDFLALLGQWGSAGTCDFDGAGVATTDFLLLLQSWGPCPTAAPPAE